MVPDRRQRARLERVAEAIGLRRMLIEAVGKGRSHHRREILIARRPVGRGPGEERHIIDPVVPDRVLVVVTGAQETIARSAVVFGAGAVVGMIGIGMSTAL